uniref:uncharacterized protein LOC101295843 n=1 Tax=Fragaria vesca subsp. vesca TaxID=101020 RepID=UPI0005C89068|nr:PREDICTED: uncharacterized protein LOC101295843 [Fragaria vesca subsp. vesca]
MAEKLFRKIQSSDHGGHSDSDSDENRNTLDHDHLDLPLEKLSLGPRKKLLVLGLGDDEKFNQDTGIDKLTLEPRRKKLLVFDLNGLLVYRVYRSNKPDVPSDRTPDGKFGNHLVFKRPFAEEFVQFCLEIFEIGIWSSALEKNVDAVIDCHGKSENQTIICVDSGFKSLEKRMKPLFFKELKKLWNHFGGQYSECDTLLIDDQPYKALLNPVIS